ncbi:MAG: hypothetical protein JWQ44_2615 [Chthoniobacter sp.]|nr:hypothetical protein [Chthoniobacter sp.]
MRSGAHAGERTGFVLTQELLGAGAACQLRSNPGSVSVPPVRRFCLLPLLFALLLSAPLLRAGEAEDKAELTKLESALSRMLIANDATALESRLAADWKLVGSDGAIVSRADLLKFFEGGKMKFTSYEATDLDVRVYRDAAVVIGRVRFSGAWNGDDFTSGSRFTDVFVRQDGQWRCVSTHTSPVE